MGVFAGITRYLAAFIIVPIVSVLLFLMFAIPVAIKLFGSYILAAIIIWLIWKFRKPVFKTIPLKLISLTKR